MWIWRRSFQIAKAIVIVLIIGLGLSVGIAYAGVEPFATYKDAVSNKVMPYISSVRQTILPTDAEIQSDTLKLINEARADVGLRPLVEISTLTALAEEHCIDMKKRGTCDHRGFEVRADRSGCSYVGENCAEGYYSAGSLVGGWLTSPGHRENMLNPSYTCTGLAYIDGWACQMFCG